MRVGSLWTVLLALPPVLAVVSGVLWATSERRQRQRALRWILIMSVALTGIEILLGIFFVIVFKLFVDSFHGD
jgi:hypothetical protein